MFDTQVKMNRISTLLRAPVLLKLNDFSTILGVLPVERLDRAADHRHLRRLVGGALHAGRAALDVLDGS